MPANGTPRSVCSWYAIAAFHCLCIPEATFVSPNSTFSRSYHIKWQSRKELHNCIHAARIQIMSTDTLTAERLRSILDYNPDTGEFHWRTAARGGLKAGRRTGCLDKSTGYIVINVDSKKRYAQRLAWLYMTGHWPDPEADHRDLDKTNNRFNNLREADKAKNMWNRKIPKTNTSGVKGVSFHKPTGKWRADIRFRGKQYFLGLFFTINEAKEAWDEAATELHGEFVYQPDAAETINKQNGINAE